jgi:hypothetical protein
MWKGEDTDQGIYYATFDGNAWSSQAILPGSTGQDLAPQPLWGLEDGSNYVLQTSGCAPVTGLSVTLTVTDEIIFASDSAPSGKTPVPGFGLQLNAYSPPGSNVGWQQYGFDVKSDGIYYWINNWEVSGPALWVPSDVMFLPTTPGTPTLPAGATLTVSLGRDAGDPEWNVATATFTIGGMANAPPPKTVKLPFSLSSGNLSPIVGFQANLVGAAYTDKLSQGAGTISVTATSPLTALDVVPACAVGYTGLTGEQANSTYTALPASAGTSFHQGFGVSN